MLFRRRAWPFYLVVLLNAVIDLGHKITIQNTVFKVHDGAEQIILTAVVNALILLPYVLFFVPVGVVANRMAKPVIMRITAWGALLLVSLLWLFYRWGWFWAAFTTTFLMSIQSAFYSPAKLGYLKVLFGIERVTAANGLAQAVVIVGILTGTLLFSLGFEQLYVAASVEDSAVAAIDFTSKNSVLSLMSPLVFALIAFALLQLIMVYRVPVLEETTIDLAVNEAQFQIHANITVQRESRWTILLGDKHLWVPMLGLALFWAMGQGVLAIFPAFAKAHANITSTAVIQSILTCTGLGVFAGAWLVERLTRRVKIDRPVRLGIAPVGIALMAVGLIVVTLWNAAWMFALNYFVLGVASGLLVVPLNAYIQLQASSRNIGSVIALSNLFQNMAMLLMLGATIAVALWGVDARVMLFGMAGVAVVVGGGVVRLIFGLMR